MNEREIVKTLAQNISRFRRNQRIPQEQLAELAGISTEYLSRIENKKYNPSIAVVVRLAKALNVNLDTLLPIDEL